MKLIQSTVIRNKALFLGFIEIVVRQFKKKNSSLTNTFYPPLMNDAPVKNSMSMKKNIIVLKGFLLLII